MIRPLALLLAMFTTAKAGSIDLLGPLDTPKPIPQYHAISGEKVRLYVALEAPTGSRLDLKATIDQVAGGITAPRDRDLLLVKEIAFTDTTRRVVPFTLETPKLPATSTLAVRLHTSLGAAPTFYLHLTPQEEQESQGKRLSSALEKSQYQLALFGESRQLRQLLSELKLPFRDLGTLRPPQFPSHSLVIAEDSEAPPPMEKLNSTRLVLLHPGPDARLPGVYQHERGNGSATVVTLPLLQAPALPQLIDLLCKILP